MTKKESGLQKLNPVREYRGVEFVFTQDIAHIEKFMELYDELCKNDPRLIGFRDFCADDINNYIGEGHYMQLLMKDGQCIGGGRLTHRPKGKDFLLPLEIDFIDGQSDDTHLLKNMIPELDVEGGCAEISRLLLMPEYRGDTFFSGALFFNFFVRYMDLEGRYLFILADKVRSRLYCHLVRKFAQRDGHIFKHLSPSNHTDFEGVELQIVGWDKQNKIKEVYQKPA